jgi:hypothetical protein
MLKINKYFWAALFVLAAVGFTGCKSDSTTTEPTVSYDLTATDGQVLTGILSGASLIPAGITVYLDGVVYVAAGGTLTIGSGVTVKSKAGTLAGLVISTGAKINAVGSESAPIVFTSGEATPTPGDWGGIVLQGLSTWNIGGGTGVTEFDTGSHGGGANPVLDDNSGTMKYMRVEFAGKKLTTTKEWNSFSFYSVGSGTTLDYLATVRSTDDGYEFFGGTVNAKHLVSHFCRDDAFDWTNGWTGKVQYAVGTAFEALALKDSDMNGIEADNDATNNDVTPVSSPQWVNLTLISDNETGYKYAMTLRRGTEAKFYNVLVENYAGKFFVDNDLTLTNASNGKLKFEGSVFHNVGGATDLASAFIGRDNAGATQTVNSAIYSSSNLYGTTNCVAPTTAYTNVAAKANQSFVPSADCGGTPINPNSKDSFFETTDYVGAIKFGATDWTGGANGWAKGSSVASGLSASAL